MDPAVTAAETDGPAAARTKKRKLWPWLVLAAMALAAFGLWRLRPLGREETKATTPAIPVATAIIRKGDLNEILSGLGTVTPLATVTVQAQIAGQLLSVGFKEGQIVKKGDFLAQIDDRPYVALKQQYEGQLAHDQAVLDQAKLDAARYETLLKQNSIARQTAEDQQMVVRQNEGSVATDKALIAQQALNIGYCRIVAPVTGRVGLRLLDPGNYVNLPNTNGIVVLTQLQPISVVFVLPEDVVPEVWAEERVGKKLNVTATNRTDEKDLASGAVEAIDNLADTTTGTVKIRANFPNDDLKLFPNQFVNARLLLRTLHDVVVAPVAAVQHGAPGTYVYRVKPDQTVEAHPIKTGVTDGDRVQIASGVEPGDEVVVDGVDRLRDGAKIHVTPDPGNPAATAQEGGENDGRPGNGRNP